MSLNSLFQNSNPSNVSQIHFYIPEYSLSLPGLIPSLTKIYTYFSSLWNTVESPIDRLNKFIDINLKSKIIGSEKVDFLQEFKSYEDPNFVHSENSKEDEDERFQEVSKIKIQKVLNTGEIISQTRFLSIAGFDTTSNTLSFVFLLLAENEKKLNTLLEEIDNFPDDFEYEDLSRLKYLHSVILETLRLFPHASM